MRVIKNKVNRKTELILFVSIIILTLATRFLHLANSNYYYIINADSFWFHHQAILAHSGQHISILGSGLAYPVSLSPYIMTILLPVILAFLILFILYIYVKPLYSKSIAIYTLFSFTLLIPCIFITESGNIDRDALEFLLFTVIIFSACFAITRKNYLILFATLACSAILVVLWFTPFKLITSIPNMITDTFKSSPAGELQYITISQIVVYVPFFVPLVLGIRYLWRQHRKFQNIFLLIWFVLTVIAGCVISRLMLFALPAICVISGIGITEFIAMIKSKSDRIASYAIAGLVIILSLAFSWKNFADTTMPRYYVNACEYIEVNTPANSEVMTWWSNGNWIDDVANRTAFADNMNWNNFGLIAQIYCSTNDSVAYSLVPDNIDYLVFSDVENHYPDAIKYWAYYKGELSDTLWHRALKSNYQSQYFSVLYQVKDKIVVLEVNR